MRARDFMGSTDRRGSIVLADYFASTKDALEGYRALKIYIDAVFDGYEFQFPSGDKISVKLQHVKENKTITAALVELMTDQMEVYRELCKLYGDIAVRRSEIVYKKYFELPGTGELEDHPYSTEDLAIYFDVDESTVRRDLVTARKELKLLFFGAQRL